VLQFGALENKSEISLIFWYVVSHRDEENQLDQSCENGKVTLRRGGKKEGRLNGLVTFCVGTAFKSLYRSKILRTQQQEKDADSTG
jgi:hypothetical protein